MASHFAPRPAEGLKYKNVVQMFAARVERTPNAPALRHKHKTAWQVLSWRQWWEASRELAAGLRVELSLQPGQTVAICSPTRFEWVVTDLALAMAGLISVPVYPSLTPEQVAFILHDANCAAALVSNEIVLREARWHTTIPVITFDPGSDKQHRNYEALRRSGAQALRRTPSVGNELAELTDRQTLSDIFTYVYTSGATGLPKGVELTHKNLVYEAWAIKNVVALAAGDEQLLVLPLAHIFARHLLWGAVEQGVVTAIGDNETKPWASFTEVAPTFVGGVPRMYEDLYGHVLRNIERQGPIARRGFHMAISLGRRVSGYRQRGVAVPPLLLVRHKVAERLFFRPIHELLGGRLRFLVCGGAALSRDIAEFFHACGLLILEGYGLSETTGATTFNRPDRFRFGTVGPAMPGCEIHIADDGEVLVRGHNVMARYHGLPAETELTIDEDGWLRTGDLGQLRNGFLTITDRKKNLFKTTSGKYVAPRKVEGRLRLQEGIGHVVVSGDGKPHAVALIALAEREMMRRSDEERLGCRTYADLVVHPRIRAIVAEHIAEVNRTLARHEQIRGFALAASPFTERTGELTPTRKVRRRNVLGQYAALIAQLYEPTDASSGPRLDDVQRARLDQGAPPR